MSDTTFYPYFGSGTLFARPAGSASGFLDCGNASKLEIAVKDKTETLKNYKKPGGGTYASVVRIEDATFGATLHDLNTPNMSRAMFGNAASVTGASVTDELVTAYKNAIVPLANINPTAVAVNNEAGTTTYVAGTDYEVRPAGIYIIPTGSIADAAKLKVDYTFATFDRVQAMTSSAIILELLFEGLNEANSGQPVIVHIYRAQFSPAKALSLLGDKFAELKMDAQILVDTSKTGVGVSQYFRVDMAAAA